MIESVQLSLIIYIDHEIAVEINRRKSLFTSFIDKFNLRLIKTFEYIQRFNLIIKHKSKKRHIILNVLSKLKFSKSNFDFEKKN